MAVIHEMLRVVRFMLKRNEQHLVERHELSRRKSKQLECVALVGLRV